MEATELTWADRLLVQGRQEGVLATWRDAVRSLVRERFGMVPQALESALASMDQPELVTMFHRAVTAQTVDELVQHP